MINSELTLTYGFGMGGSHCLAIWVMMLLQVLLPCAIFPASARVLRFLTVQLVWMESLHLLVDFFYYGRAPCVWVCRVGCVGEVGCVRCEVWYLCLAILHRWGKNSFFFRFMNSMVVWLTHSNVLKMNSKNHTLQKLAWNELSLQRLLFLSITSYQYSWRAILLESVITKLTFS